MGGTGAGLNTRDKQVLTLACLNFGDHYTVRSHECERGTHECVRHV